MCLTTISKSWKGVKPLVAGDVARTIQRALDTEQRLLENKTKPNQKEIVQMTNTNQSVKVGNVTYGVEREINPAREAVNYLENINLTGKYWFDRLAIEAKVFGTYGMNASVMKSIAKLEYDEELKTNQQQVAPNVTINSMTVNYVQKATDSDGNVSNVQRQFTVDGNGRRVTKFKTVSPSQETAIESMRSQLGIMHNMVSKPIQRPSKLNPGTMVESEGGKLLPHTRKMMSIDSASLMIEDLQWMIRQVAEYEAVIAGLKDALQDKEKADAIEKAERERVRAIQERQAMQVRSGRI